MVFFSIASCEAELGHLTEAAEGFERFLRGALLAEPELRAEAQRKLRTIADRLLIAELRGAPDRARLLVDQAAAPRPIEPVPLYLTPGPHALRLEREAGGPFVKMVRGGAGERILVDIPPVAPSGADLTPGHASGAPVYKRWWFWGGVAAVVAAGAVGVYALTRRPDCPGVCP